VVAVTISPDGDRLACLGAGRQIEVLSWPTAAPLWRHRDPPGYAAYCHIACFSPCGRFLIVPTDDDACNLAIWSVQSGRRLGELRGHTKIALGARFAPDGHLVSWGTDGTIRTWDVERQRVLRVVSLAAAEHSS
jgi:WD40 repeat protein